MPTPFLGLIPRYVVALISNLSLSVRTDISVPFSLKLARSRKLSDAVITTATEQKSSQQPPRLQQLQNQPTPSGNSSVPSSLSRLAFKIAPFCLSPCPKPLIQCKFCFQTCREPLPECPWVLASGLTLGCCLRPQVTECLILKYISREQARPRPLKVRGDSCRHRWCGESQRTSLSTDIWPVAPSQDTQIASSLDWRQWSQGSCPSALWSLTTVGTQTNVRPHPLAEDSPPIPPSSPWLWAVPGNQEETPSLLSLSPCPCYSSREVDSVSFVTLGTCLDFLPGIPPRTEVPCKHKLDELRQWNLFNAVPWHPAQSLKHRMHSKNICWMNNWTL